MKKCRLCHSKKVAVCGARRLNSLFHTTDFTRSNYGKISDGLINAIFPIAESIRQYLEPLLGLQGYKPAVVTEVVATDDVVMLCRSCGLWIKASPYPLSPQ